MRPDEIVGNERVREGLLRAAASGRLAHAYLFCGPEGVGRRTFALALVKTLACTGAGGAPCGVCPNCTEVEAGTYRDLHVLGPRGRLGLIKVEQVRALVEVLSRRSSRPVGPFVIVDGADRMGAQAANALLKTLEEPPPGALIVLVASQPDRLLPTVRSRCVRVDFGPVDAPLIERMLVARGFEPEEAAARALAARGAPGTALLLAPEDVGRRGALLRLLPRLDMDSVPLALEAAAALDAELRELRDAEEASLAEAAADLDAREREEIRSMAAEEAAARMNERVAAIFEVMLAWCREAAASACGAEPADAEVAASAAAAGLGPAEAARLGGRIGRIARSALGTGQLRLCLEAAFLSVCAARGAAGREAGVAALARGDR